MVLLAAIERREVDALALVARGASDDADRLFLAHEPATERQVGPLALRRWVKGRAAVAKCAVTVDRPPVLEGRTEIRDPRPMALTGARHAGIAKGGSPGIHEQGCREVARAVHALLGEGAQ